MVAYPAIVHHEDEQYWIEFPDVNGCFTSADTLPELLSNATEALGGHLCCLMDMDQPLPRSTDPADVKAVDGFTTVVATDPYRYKKDTRAIKKTLTIPAWLNEEAEKRHINFSSVLQKALVSMIQ